MCGKDHMDVHLSFSAPFDGIVSSKGMFRQMAGQKWVLPFFAFERNRKKPTTHFFSFPIKWNSQAKILSVCNFISLCVIYTPLPFILDFFSYRKYQTHSFLSFLFISYRQCDTIMQVSTVIRDVFMCHRHQERHSMHFVQRMHDAVQNRI